MKLNREQIIKALECCTNAEQCCDDCILLEDRNCGVHLLKNALSLIKELNGENEAWQKQLITTKEKADKAYYELACEVESLRKENESLHTSCTELTRKCASLTVENERLREENNRLVVSEVGEVTLAQEIVFRVRNEHPVVVAIRADTVQKMQERLKQVLREEGRSSYYLKATIDQIAKEMLEGK